VSLWVVDVSKIDPPAGAEPVHWRLLTTHALSSLAEARRVVDWYRQRWTIEQVFRSPAQPDAGGSHRKAEKPARSRQSRLVCLDRRPPRRMVRLYLTRIQAPRT
jgi:hypothetical protein